MPAPPATAITLEELVRDKVLAAPTLLALLAQGANSYFPRPGAVPDGSVPVPFIVTRFGGRNGTHQVIASWQCFVYDQPNRQYWRIEEILNELRLTFQGKFFPASALGHRRYDGVPIRVEGDSGHLTDGGWNKNMMLTRMTIMGL